MLLRVESWHSVKGWLARICVSDDKRVQQILWIMFYFSLNATTCHNRLSDVRNRPRLSKRRQSASSRHDVVHFGRVSDFRARLNLFKAALSPLRCEQHWSTQCPLWLGGRSQCRHSQGHTPSTAFRHLPPKVGCRKPVLEVWVRGWSAARPAQSGCGARRKLRNWIKNQANISKTNPEQQLTNKQDKVSFFNYFLLLSYICSTSVVTVRTTEEGLTKARFFLIRYNINSQFFNDYCNSRLRWD